jgi:hypothetical protein
MHAFFMLIIECVQKLWLFEFCSSTFSVDDIFFAEELISLCFENSSSGGHGDSNTGYSLPSSGYETLPHSGEQGGYYNCNTVKPV